MRQGNFPLAALRIGGVNRRMPRLPQLTQPALVVGLALALVVAGCGRDLLLSAVNLNVSPNPAQPGDFVTFTFSLTIVPAQSYSITAFIDDGAFTAVEGAEAVSGPYVMEIADATDLIARYGEGMHTAYVEVRLGERDRLVRTGEEAFELQAAEP